MMDECGRVGEIAFLAGMTDSYSQPWRCSKGATQSP